MSKVHCKARTPHRPWLAGLALVAASALASPAFAQATKVVDIAATAQTQSVPTKGDAADDIAIWVNSSDTQHSRIFATDKKAGVIVHDLSGEIVQSLLVGRINNIDLREGFVIDGKPRVLVAGSERDANAARLWLVDAEHGTLVDAPGQRVDVAVPEPYGLCLARSGSGNDARTYVFTSDRTRGVVQHELTLRDGVITATLVRTFETVGEVEGMVADDALGVVYFAEENACIWRVPIDPSVTLGRAAVDAKTPVVLSIPDAATGADRAKPDAIVVVSRVGPGMPIMPDVEGLAIARVADTGVLLASSQGDSSFAVFDRTLANQYRGSFRLVASKSVDAVEETDGIEVACASMGASYPFGVFVAQDGKVEGRSQNFKLVPWEIIARAFEPSLPIGAK